LGQSLSQNYLHLIFGTKNRYPFISSEIEKELHSYMASTLKELDSPALIINSMPDHVHILFKLSKNFSLAKVVEEIKKSSSKWMKTKGIQDFSWQIGYGAFSVSSSKLEAVNKYIAHQKEHHKIKSFQEEVEQFMKEYQLKEYEADFFWK
jgi:REP element-mobilizing transposase RayT